jgi:hypothetical protein
MTRVQIVGGIAIAGGIVLSRASRRVRVDTVTA